MQILRHDVEFLYIPQTVETGPVEGFLAETISPQFSPDGVCRGAADISERANPLHTPAMTRSGALCIVVMRKRRFRRGTPPISHTSQGPTMGHDPDRLRVIPDCDQDRVPPG